MATLEKDELQWFYYLVIDRELVPEEPCRALLRDLGPEAPLVAVTQAIFDQGLCGDFGALQQAAALARINARRGPPARTIRPAHPKLVEHEPEARLDLPDLAGVETLSMTDAGAIMRGILGLVRQYGASDLHVSAGSPIYWRKHGRLEMCPPENALTPEAASHLCLSLLDEEAVAVFEDQGDVGVALELEGGCRYRANVSYSRSGVTGTYHIVPDEVRPLEELGFA
ncbi:MAG: hypothetical protein RBU25_21240, partial [Lentisphaeria bacterium]|nr:hypothetical protein [Lentisphaeria bacterium]